MTGVELSQTALKREIYSLRQDTSEIKSMMTEMYATFQGQPSSAPLGSVTPTLALIDIQENVEGENENTTTTKEPPSHTEGETEKPLLAIPISSILSTIDKGKGIATEFDDDPLKKLVKASSIIRPNPDEPVRVEFMINGKIVASRTTRDELGEFVSKIGIVYVRYNGYRVDFIEVFWPCDGSIEDLDELLIDLE
ncbi:hypothetical protein Tco_1367225 [Tanacetum coccineum]